MPMRNSGAYLSAAMTSILTQSEPDFTFLIIDDGSTDRSVEIATSLADDRTHVIDDGRHLGMAARLNWGLDHARTRLVARMDADDVADPHRLAHQLAFMETHPKVGVCGSWYKFFATGKPPREARLPLGHDRLQAMTLFSSPFAHPTVIFNLKHVDAADLRYSAAAFPAEDYDLWERARSAVTFANIPQFLLNYRIHPEQISAAHFERQRAAADGVRLRALSRLGIDPSQGEGALHCDYAADHEMDRIVRMRAAMAWLRKLERIAEQRDEQAVVAECARRRQELWSRIGRHARLKLRAGMGGLRRLSRGSS
jgi:glycosyltransferase involved in cell wall biosynthesis